jgi:broad specificity phosphatase PhoE
VAEEVKYYAIVSSGRTAQTPSGIARRRLAADGPFDEALRRDLTWQPDSAIVEWEYGDVGADLVEISEAEAEQLIERFRQKWDAQG